MPSARLTLIAAALTLTAALTACGADRAVAPDVRAPRVAGPAASLAPGLTSAPVLYDQTLAGSGIVSISGAPNGVLADDFTVPAGQTWTVAQVVLSGRLHNVTALPLSIHADANGAVGAAVANVGATLAGSAQNPCCGTGPSSITDYVFTLSSPVTLPPGTYWLAAEVTTGGTGNFEWHAVQTHQQGVQPAGSYDRGATWYANFLDADLGFALLASAPAQQAQTIAFATITPNPAIVGATAALSATASSGLTVTFSAVASSGVCTVSGTTVHFVGAGTCTIAADQAGDASYAAAPRVSQSVRVDYRFDGFAAPVDNGVPNAARAGQAIPLRWRLTDAAGAPVTTLTSATITAVSLACSLGSTADQVEEYAAGGSGLQNLGNGYYQLNWKTPTSYAGSCKTLQLQLGEGSGPRTAVFQFTR